MSVPAWLKARQEQRTLCPGTLCHPDTCSSSPSPIAANLQLLPWVPELTSGKSNISEVSYIAFSPGESVAPHCPSLLSFPSDAHPPPIHAVLRWGCCALCQAPLLGLVQVLHFPTRLFLFCVSENCSILSLKYLPALIL